MGRLNEHDEAVLVSYLRDLLTDGPLTADEMLANCREVLDGYQQVEGAPRGAHAQQTIDQHRQAVADIATWERILGDPALMETLVRIEDDGIFGG